MLRLPLAAAFLAALALGTVTNTRAEDPAASAPAELYEQTDGKRTVSIKLPRTWKAQGGENVDPNALATFAGFYGQENQGANGAAMLYVEHGFARANLARAVVLPQVGRVKEGSLRQGPGWAEGCAINEQNHAIWRRYAEKGGRVYLVQIVAHARAYDSIHAQVEALLDTMAVPGEFKPPSLGQGFDAKKLGGFEVWTDAAPDRESSVKKASDFLGQGRETMEKALPGKPFDASRPIAAVYQNGQKFEDRAKAALAVAPDHACFNPVDRSAMVKILGESTQGYDDEILRAAAAQYVWQYFGGHVPLWCDLGLAAYGQYAAAGGGKGKLPPNVLPSARGAVGVGKRRLDEWFDVKSKNEITDEKQGKFELFAWHWFFRHGRGSKKYRKQYDGYIAALRDTGDPALARKAFDGVDFEEMLKEFRSWAEESK